MAVYHFTAQIIKRSEGKSAVAAAAYRSGTALYDERQKTTHDYSRRGGVVSEAILLPRGSDPALSDRSKLWNLAEASEARRDAQVAREINLSLPHELTADQRRDLLHRFVDDQFVKAGMAADVAIHSPQVAKGDHPNHHHAHIMLTLRQATPHGLAKIKTREWNSDSALHHWRKKWADIQNQYLERHGHKDRVDHRTLEQQHADALARGDKDAARALDRQPEIYVGKNVRYAHTTAHQPKDRMVTTPYGRSRYRFYSVTDQGSRADFNASIIKPNRDAAATHSRDLQVEKARLMQKRFAGNTQTNGALHHWERAKGLYGQLPANERPSRYWEALRDVIASVPLKDHDNPWSIFTIPKFDEPNSLEKLRHDDIPMHVEPFDTNKLREHIDEGVADYFSLQKALMRLGLIDRKLDGMARQISVAMDLEAVRNRRYFDFRKRYQEKQHRKNQTRKNVLEYRRFRKAQDDKK